MSTGRSAPNLRDLAGRLLDMRPDPVPKCILLKEFMRADPEGSEYQNALDAALHHPHAEEIESGQNPRGFWPPFHGFTENKIRRALSLGLPADHPPLVRCAEYLGEVLAGRESWDQYEKQDHPRWWPDMFVPLASAAMLKLLGISSPDIRARWAGFAEAAFAGGRYDREAEAAAQRASFGFATKRPIPAFNYYNLILLSPDNGGGCLSEPAQRALVDFCMGEARGIYYVYNEPLSDPVPISARRSDSRDFCHWLRALSLVSQFKGWETYRKGIDAWVLAQRDSDGLWELPRKPDRFDFPLSDSWRARKNRVIDSTILVMRFLNRGPAF